MKVQKKKIAQKEKQIDLHEDGSEVLDPTPLVVPVGFTKPPTLQEQIRRLFKAEKQIYEDRLKVETFEEADDFDVDDDFDPTSPWELNFDSEADYVDQGKHLEEKPIEKQEKVEEKKDE